MDRLFCRKFYEKLLGKYGKRNAQHFISILNNILNTAKDYGYIEGENPCTKMKIEKNPPRNKVWGKQEFNIFCEKALQLKYNGLYIAMSIAYHTAQRQTDILNLKWLQIDNEFKYIDIIQSKTASKVSIPLFKIEQLKNVLANMDRKNEYVVVDDSDNKPYNHRQRLFSDRFETIREQSGIRRELLFRDLRRTAILALDEAGCTPAAITSISGHSRQSIISMLDTYAPNTKEKSANAMDKLNAKNLIQV